MSLICIRYWVAAMNKAHEHGVVFCEDEGEMTSSSQGIGFLVTNSLMGSCWVFERMVESC